MEKKRDMKKHVTFVAALHIGFGVLGIILALTVFFAIGFASSFVEDVDVATEVLTAVKIFLPVIMGLTSVLGLIGGIGLLGYNQWARILVIIVSALNCLHVPIGTAKGVYSIWALMQDETIVLFNQGSNS